MSASIYLGCAGRRIGRAGAVHDHLHGNVDRFRPKSVGERYGRKLQDKALPALNDLESRSRQEVQRKLAHATRKCKDPYSKGEESFKVLGKLSSTVLKKHLPSFRRVVRILNKNCE